MYVLWWLLDGIAPSIMVSSDMADLIEGLAAEPLSVRPELLEAIAEESCRPFDIVSVIEAPPSPACAINSGLSGLALGELELGPREC